MRFLLFGIFGFRSDFLFEGSVECHSDQGTRLPLQGVNFKNSKSCSKFHQKILLLFRDVSFIKPRRTRSFAVSPMALIDSKAAFKQRCAELSTTALDLHSLLTAQHIECFSELAFACGTPNKSPTDDEFRNFSNSVLGNGASQGHQSLLRRLHFEAATFVLSQLKTAVHGDPLDGSKKLPFAETSQV